MSTRLSPAVVQALAVLRWTEHDARLVLDALATSGLTRADFARTHRVSAHRLYVWQRRLAQIAPAHEDEVGAPFVEVRLPDRAKSVRLEFVSPMGPLVRLDGPLDVDTVRLLLRVLREPGPC